MRDFIDWIGYKDFQAVRSQMNAAQRRAVDRNVKKVVNDVYNKLISSQSMKKRD